MKEAVETFPLESFSLVVPRPLCPPVSPPLTSSWPPQHSVCYPYCLSHSASPLPPPSVCVTFSHHILLKSWGFVFYVHFLLWTH